MITFLTIPRAFAGEFDYVQRRAIASWQTCAPGCQVMLFGCDSPNGCASDEAGTARVCREMGLIQCRDIAYHQDGSPLADRAFALADRYAAQRWLCFTSSDIVFDASFAAILDALSGIERPLVIGQRRDIESGDGLSGYVLHPPCGVDYFLYRRGTIGRVLPFAVRGGAGDNWLVWKALTAWKMTVIDATADILAYHFPHSHPEWANGKRGRQGSLEQRHNQALARADGMDRACGIDDAPFVLRAGQVMARKTVIA